jgi:hypothetical protein
MNNSNTDRVPDSTTRDLVSKRNTIQFPTGPIGN